MKRKIARGFSVVFGPDDKRDYDTNKSDLRDIVTLGTKVEADFIEVRFFGDPEHRSKRLIIPEKIFTVREIEDVVAAIKGEDLGINLHLSQELIPYLENPRKLGYDFLEHFDHVIGHRADMDIFIPDLADRVLSQAAQGNEKFLAPLGEKSVIDKKLRDLFLIENGFDAKDVLHKTSYLAANRYHIGNVVDIVHFIRGLDPEFNNDSPSKYARYSGKKLELTYATKEIFKNTSGVHISGITSDYVDHVPLRRPGLSTAIPDDHKKILYEGLKIANRLRFMTVELKKQYQTPKNIKMTAEKFEALLGRIRHGNQ